ncbi:aldose epimerase family protein [Pseudobacter ginsenosidimutans]|uniref:Aldose 1-epimerase n=1 Tax=Pseudobacter ginsenosidimutans TaxID=661488 RepID=A0A4Q7MLN1_9BACT|nr:aldose epimerase family protein [Pseudobacter ginsenosidimutans]QEC40180.1 galactose mutarotase [Pseudobacter ginsenosidimutans]RZS69226.1 aldose 1-epimerase [Pseudobacter ginsenosidimutans]
MKYATAQETGEKASVTVLPYNGDERILRVRLRNRNIIVELTNIGSAITAIYTPGKNDGLKNIVAGYADLKNYLHNPDYYGVVVGRYANRIAAGHFSINGKEYQVSVNNGSNHLHGGVQGFSHKFWTVTSVKENEQQCSVVFSYNSADGEEGYPGNMSVSVEYQLDDAGRLHIHYSATTDKSTPVNLTNHSYFNLTGFEQPSILDHLLEVNASAYTEKSENDTPTGQILSVTGTALDFRKPGKLSKGVDQFPADMGYDHNFVLDKSEGNDLEKAAVLSEASSGRTVTVYTTKPGMQLYTANFWNGSIIGQQGVAYRQHGGVALETQSFPDSVHHPHFPSTILHPGEQYRTTTIFEFGIIAE